MTHSNAKLNGAAVDSGAVNGKDKNDNKVDSSAAGTGLKCLEDPTFSFDEPSSKSLPADTAKENSKETGQKRPSYRVLEDPDLDVAPPRAAGKKIF